MERSMRTYLCVALSIMVVIAGYAASPWLPAVYSQEPTPTPEPSRPTSVVINHIVPIPPENNDEAGQGLELRVFFTVLDQYGAPIPEPGSAIREVEFTVQQAGMDGKEGETTYSTTVIPKENLKNDENNHIYIAFLMDASGSMCDYKKNCTEKSGKFPIVIESAVAAVGEAFDNTRFAVYRFAIDMESLIPKTDQDEQGSNRISDEEHFTEIGYSNNAVVAIENYYRVMGDEDNQYTCIYQNTWKVISNINKVVDKQRRAIILFSDGKDTCTNQVNPTIPRTREDVVQKAHESQVPIYTVGYYEPEEDDPLEYIAAQTGAKAIVDTDERAIGEAFKDIMTALNSQQAAQEDVSASKGDNTLTLKVYPVYPQDREGPLPGVNGESPPTSTFYSDDDYEISRDITFHDALHDKNDNKWKIRFTLEHPQSINKISIQAMDEENQSAAKSEPITPITGEMTATLEISEMGEYTFRAMADGQEIGNTISYSYNPFSVDAIEPVWDDNTLKISIKPKPRLEDTYTYDVSASKETTDFLSATEVPGNPNSDKVTLSITPIPDEMWKSKEGDKYQFAVTMQIGQIGEDKKEAGTMEKTLEIGSSDNTASPPTFFQKTGHLLNTPIISDGGIRYIHGLLLIVLVAVALVVYPRLRRKTVSIPAPYTPPTTNLEEPPQVTLRVIETPESSQKQETTIFVFPCTIGRGTDANLRITGDKKISRKHASITIQDNEFFITDLGSSHGTFLGETRLTPNMPAPLKGVVTVRLGTETRVEMEAQQPGRRRR